jgi:hypothetical protein
MYRQGEVTAEALQQQFALAFQSQGQSIFLELAELLSSQKQKAKLLEAAAKAGWLPEQHLGEQDPLPSEDHGTPVTDQDRNVSHRVTGDVGMDPSMTEAGWKPLDRTRIAVVAAASLPSVSPYKCPCALEHRLLSAMHICGCIIYLLMSVVVCVRYFYQKVHADPHVKSMKLTV